MRAFVHLLAALAWVTLLDPTAGSAQAPLGPERPPLLTTLHDVNSLGLEEAAKGLGVKAKGIITFYDRERGSLMLQDASSGVAVRIPATREGIDFDPQPGQLVEVEGVTGRARARAVIRGKTLHLIGRAEMPAPYELKSQTPLQPKADGLWIHVQGWIPTVTRVGTRLSSDLILSPGQSVEFTANGADSPEANELAGSLVGLVGVYNLRYDGEGKIIGARISVNDLASFKKIKSVPITAITDAGASLARTDANQPFRVRATVVNHSLGEFLIVRDNSGSLRVPYRGLSYFASGSLVEVFAYPVQRRPELVLTNIMVRLVPADASNEEPVATIVTPAAPNTNLTTLTHIMQIRKLSPNDASRGYPTRIIGVITFCDLGSYLHFIQDETSGIYMDLSRVENPGRLHSGQKVEVQGFSGPGDYAPILIAQAVRLLQEEPLPSPEVVTFRKLMRGNFDSQWVMLKGVVRNQWITTNSSTLALFTGDGVIKAIIPGPAKQLPSGSLVDSAVEVQAVCRTIFDDHRRLQGVELQVPDWTHVNLREPATADPFKLPVRPVNELFQFHADGSDLHRAHLVGVVTLLAPDGSFYLQDGSGGIQIQPGPTNASIQVGTTVDAVGFPVIVNQLAMLQDALVRPLKDFTQVEPAEVKPDASLEDTLQATLVKLDGEVLGHFSHWSEEVLTVRFGQRIIDAVLQRDNQPEQLAAVAPGTVVRLTGVLVGQVDTAGTIQSFRVMLRSVEDVRVVTKPAWWTVRNTLWTVAVLATVLLLALAWVRALRRQVHQRTVELHEEIEHHKRTETRLEAEIAERKRMEIEIERSHQELLIASRQAGMAEVATSVLHNVGNVLNSVNVSAGVVAEKIRRSRLNNITRAAEMLKENATDLAHFLEHDPKGRQLPQYLGRLAEHLTAEHTSILEELESLRKNVEHIKGIVGMQQKYAKVFGSAEPINPAELVEDALRMHNGALVRHEVRVVRQYEENLPQIVVDKHKLLQILVNLIGNAKNACDESLQPEKVVKVCVANTDGGIQISVSDNGVGIAPENLTRIFNHGFTTRKDGHGFGLHSGALAAKEMGGALVAASAGPGKGARFTVELPIKGN